MNFEINLVKKTIKIATTLQINDVVVSTFRNRLKTAKNLSFTINRTHFAIVIDVLMTVGALVPIFIFSMDLNVSIHGVSVQLQKTQKRGYEECWAK